jgi:hypothetical protein
MKKLLMPFTVFLTLFAVSCGPAAEDRQMMHMRAKVFQDSIANAIRMAIAEAEGPAPAVMAPDTASQRMQTQGNPPAKK